MKYTIVSIIIIGLLVLGGFYLFNKKASGPTTIVEQGSDLPQATEAGTFELDKDRSVFNWYGEMLGIRSHSGTVKLSSGSGTINEDGIITGGSFQLDMNTIKENDNTEMLENHLKSADFFDVENHPTASFEITSIQKDPISPAGYTVVGNLTVKGITNEINFPATISQQSDLTYVAVADIEIDRSKWDVRYGSTSFFSNLGDRAISNTIKLNLRLITNPVAQAEVSSDSEITN